MNLEDLIPLFPLAGFLALEANVSSWRKARRSSRITNLTMEEVIRTKCRLTSETLAYLLSFVPSQEGNLAYWFRLTAYRDGKPHRQKTGIGHSLILLPLAGNYFLLDSYIGCRGLTIQPVEFSSFRSKIAQLERKYSADLWLELTDCVEEAKADYVEVEVRSYNFRLDEVTVRYQELLENKINPKYGL